MWADVKRRKLQEDKDKSWESVSLRWFVEINRYNTLILAVLKMYLDTEVLVKYQDRKNVVKHIF
jgi:hypothetical protein